MTVIKVENLGKKYRIGANGASSDGLRHAIHDLFTNPLRKARNGHSNADLQSVLRAPHSEEFWALKDVSFEVKQGEVVGVIGRNGAGKSTLLKILSRITEPTTGRLGIRGRVASLLEVGTGFHPELTGRENVFLNGAILGMTREEIKRKFDEIVAFAEVEKFIDTPVKRYSSGMYVRLAFAVAAHLEPEILIVDEVLAVGDAQFQKKCLGKMGSVAAEGRTVLFVSHNMTGVRTLCHRGMVLDKGKKSFDGPVSEAINLYSASAILKDRSSWIRPADAQSSSIFFEEVNITLQGQQPDLKLLCDISLTCLQRVAPSFVAVDIRDQMLSPIMQALPESAPFIEGVPGLHKIQMEIDLPPLVPGFYGVDFWVGSHFSSTVDQLNNTLVFEVTQSPSSNRSFPYTPDHGFMVPVCRYSYTPPRTQVAEEVARLI